MFGLFKKKKAQTLAELLLGLSGRDFLFKVDDLIGKGPPSAQVMRVIAYQNMGVIMEAMAEVAKRKPNDKLPKTIEDHIRFFEQAMDDDTNNEIAARRLGWFFQAALLKRAEALWQLQPQCDEAMAKIWIALADGCYCLPTLIQTIVIWSDKEKIWFSHIRQEKEAIEYCLNQVAPKGIRQLKAVREYAKTKDLWLSP